MIRTAISPRFAINTDLNMRPDSNGPRAHRQRFYTGNFRL
jgi:hypothetical protein